MRKHRVIHKSSKSIIIPQVPQNVLTSDGRFYVLTPAVGIYIDMTSSVAVDEFTGTFDMNQKEVYENDLVEVGLRFISDEKNDHIGWVKAHAIVVYNEQEMGWNLEVLTPQYKDMPPETEWDIHLVIGNRWQSGEVVERLRLGAVVSNATS